ncbi:MAG: CcmD family protein [Bacteroidia bacterium]|nr:CcmD family protein [Bacteroidia bacterium]
MKQLLLLPVLLTVNALHAQDTPEMADVLRQDGKFWVVVVCLLTILLGILSWVFVLDRKISKLEKDKK